MLASRDLICQGENLLRKVANLTAKNKVERSRRLLPFRDDYYADGVTPADVLLIIEVSSTTLRYDQAVKLPLYAAAGIPEVWIIDVGRQQLNVYRHPREERYQSANTLSRDETVSATQFSLTVAVKELIG